jgi:glyoxylase I family protein
MTIDHINIVVTDLEKMLTFYRDVLSLTVTKSATIEGDWIGATVGLTNVNADVVYLDFETGPRLELIRYNRPSTPRPPQIDQPNAPGLRHFALRIENIDALVERLSKANVKFFSKVQTVPDTQVTYANNIQKRLIYFQDPEGNLLEFCEYKPR